MNPNNFEQSGITLPAPNSGGENVSSAEGAETKMSVSPESRTQQPNLHPLQSNNQASPPLVSSVGINGLQQPINGAVQPQLNDTVSTPPTAIESDRIEKEWIEVTKRVVSSYREDPALLSKLVANIKAEYIRKRYYAKER